MSKICWFFSDIEKVLQPQDIITDYDDISEKLTLQESSSVARQQADKSKNRLLNPESPASVKKVCMFHTLHHQML